MAAAQCLKGFNFLEACPSAIFTFFYIYFNFVDLSEKIKHLQNSPAMMLDLIFCLLSAAA